MGAKYIGQILSDIHAANYCIRKTPRVSFGYEVFESRRIWLIFSLR